MIPALLTRTSRRPHRATTRADRALHVGARSRRRAGQQSPRTVRAASAHGGVQVEERDPRPVGGEADRDGQADAAAAPVTRAVLSRGAMTAP